MNRSASAGRNRSFWPALPLSIWSVISLVGVGGCAAERLDATGGPPQPVRLDHTPFVYVIVNRDRRLPAEFTRVFDRLTQDALPRFRVSVAEDLIDAKEATQADWILTVRATRIVPHYTFTPSDDNAWNGFADCVAGSAVLVGLVLAPCLITGDEEALEAEIRDAQSRLIKRYLVEETAGGFTLVPPLTYLSNRDATVRLENLAKALYSHLRADGVFDHTVSPTRNRSSPALNSAGPESH